MKRKKSSLIFVFLTFLFFGCDGNFGVKSLNSTLLVIKDIEESNIELFCESEKLLLGFTHCDEIVNEGIQNWILEEKIIMDKNNVKIFDVPFCRTINDRNNIDIYFEAIVNNEKYIGTVFIKTLQEDSDGSLFSEHVVLKSSTGSEIQAAFCYQFWRSI